MFLHIDMDHENRGMKLNVEYLVGLAERPCLAHEIRYPGEDTTNS